MNKASKNHTASRPFGSFQPFSWCLLAALGAGVLLAACKGEEKPPLTPDDEKMFDVDASMPAPTAIATATATAQASATASAVTAPTTSAKPAAKK